jgi:hypothetical protein
MIFLTHQTYTPEDISFSGRVAVDIHSSDTGTLLIDAVQSLRKANTDFQPTYLYRCPIRGGKPFHGEEKVEIEGFTLPLEIRSKVIRDVYRIPGNPNIDFEVYANTNQLFYHDMFLAHK